MKELTITTGQEAYPAYVLNLPPEILHRILFFSALNRGITRALRLKLVCKTFHIFFDAAFFETRLLDEFAFDIRYDRAFPTRDWRIRKHHGAEQLWHSYTVYRVQNETLPTKGNYVEIRQVARRVCNETGEDYKETVDSLCWLALERPEACLHFGHYGNNRAHIGPFNPHNRPNMRLSLLSAAAHFGHLSLARKLLSEGQSPNATDGLFPTPIFLAAFAGNVDMLKLFQDHLASVKYWDIIDGVAGAFQRGDLNMVKIAANIPLIGTPEESRSQVPTETLQSLYDQLRNTRSCQVYQYICALTRDDPPGDAWRSHLLAHHAYYGNLNMVRLLLDDGVDLNKKGRHTATPLIAAIDGCHEDIVDLLLERGADPNWNDQSQYAEPIVAASKTGSLSIVRKLLEYGANLDKHSAGCGAVVNAVKREHTAMLELFVEAQPTYEWIQPLIVESALTRGLESIAEHFSQKPCRLQE